MTIENKAAFDGADDAALFAEITSVEAADAPATDSPANVQSEPKTETTAAPRVETQEKEPVRVPLNELLEERRQRQEETRQRQALERQMSELVAAMKANQPAPQPVQQPEIWTDPEQFVDARVASATEQQRAALMYNARLIAEARFTESAVREAQEAFDAQVQAGNLHPADYQKVMNSPNPFAEAVKWHQANKIVSEVGTDPTAYKAKLKAELLNDPEFRKEMMAQLQGQATSTAGRQSPSISLPSLSRVGATALPGGNTEPDDAALWESVTTAKRR